MATGPVSMGKRQAAFRDDFRAKMSTLYSGPLHVLMIYAIGLATIWFCARQIASPAWYEWLIVPASLVIANVFEWWIHKYVMHRPIKGYGNFFMGIYKRHTLAHHQFFTVQEPTVDSSRDFRIVFFPPYALTTFIMISIVPAFVLNQLGFPDAGWLLLCANTFMYLNYELFHWCCHVKDDSLVKRLPFVSTIRRHHIAHHDTAQMMERNFNLTYPVADCLFGTSDLDRGVIGHIFNGYSTAHVKPYKRRLIGSVDDPLAGAARQTA